jgi:hypothetical protein
MLQLTDTDIKIIIIASPVHKYLSKDSKDIKRKTEIWKWKTH